MNLKLGFEIHVFSRKLRSSNRSLTEEGAKKTLPQIVEHLPNLAVKSVASVTKAFDWIIIQKRSGRSLCANLSTKKSGEKVRLMMDFISSCDDNSSLLEIADSLNLPIWNLYDAVDKHKSHNLINSIE